MVKEDRQSGGTKSVPPRTSSRSKTGLDAIHLEEWNGRPPRDEKTKCDVPPCEAAGKFVQPTSASPKLNTGGTKERLTSVLAGYVRRPSDAQALPPPTTSRTSSQKVFSAADVDGDGTIDAAEFAQVYARLKRVVQEEQDQKRSAKRATTRAHRRVKLASRVAFMLFLLVVILLFGNLGLTYLVVYWNKETRVGSTTADRCADAASVACPLPTWQ